MKTSKRILKVVVKRMLDDSPDTSYLGEYSNRPESEYAIDRAHSEDCASVTPETLKAKETLEHAQQTVGDMYNQLEEKESESRLHDCERCGHPELEHENGRCFHRMCEDDACQCQDYSPNANDVLPENIERDALDEAYDMLGELAGEVTECDCSRAGRMDSREYRYFNGPVENYKGDTPENIRKYVRQDYDRMESLNAGHWCYIGIRAEAQVVVSGHAVQRITSGGLWGIESDSGKDYLQSVVKEELADLRGQLKALGFSSRATSAAFKNVEEVND